MAETIYGEQLRRNAAIQKLIDSRIGYGQRCRSLKQMADFLKMNYTTLRSKYNKPETFRFDDLCTMFRKLKVKDDEVVAIFGVEYAGKRTPKGVRQYETEEMVMVAKVENFVTGKRSKSIVVDEEVRACINCIWFEQLEQHYRENRGNIRGFVPISSGTCIRHDQRRGALRQPCRDYETKEDAECQN